MSDTKIRFFIGVPELARLTKQSRQTIHYRAANNQLHVRSYMLRTGRRITYIFDEAEVNAYLATSEKLWADRRFREGQ
jgi:cytidylate kinase